MEDTPFHENYIAFRRERQADSNNRPEDVHFYTYLMILCYNKDIKIRLEAFIQRGGPMWAALHPFFEQER